MRISVPLRRSYKLINHGPTTLISSADGGRRDVMAAAWVMAIDFDPPKLAAVIAADTYTRELVEASGEFAVNLPTRAMAAVTFEVGNVSGRDTDKFARFGIATTPGTHVKSPLIDGCAGWLECRVLPEPGILERYDLYIAEIVAAWADDEVWKDGAWAFTGDESRTIHHLSGGTFLSTGERFKVP